MFPFGKEMEFGVTSLCLEGGMEFDLRFWFKIDLRIWFKMEEMAEGIFQDHIFGASFLELDYSFCW